jgi:hypothetical protein
MNRTILFVWLALCATHITLAAIPYSPIAPFVAGTIFLPLFALKTIGLPVFGSGVSGGWSTPSLLGWILVALLWAGVWWVIVRGLAALFRIRSR